MKNLFNVLFLKHHRLFPFTLIKMKKVKFNKVNYLIEYSLINISFSII